MTNSPSISSEPRPRVAGVLIGLGLLVAVGTAGMIQYARNLKIRTATTQPIAPGLSLTKIKLNTPGGEIPQYIVRANIKNGWKLRLVAADDSVLQRRTVSQIATNWNAKNKNAAPVAINGGYFAYGSAAVGAVKIDGEWIRLPWKSRTSIGWTNGARPQISSLSAKASVVFDTFSLPVDNLNGYPTATTSALLTRRFASNYTLKSGEVAIVTRDDKVQSIIRSGAFAIGAKDRVLVSGAQASTSANVAAAHERLKIGDKAIFRVATTPASWNDFSTILGAGPRLIENGTIKITHVEEEFRPDVLARGPRTTIGIDKAGNLIILVVEAWHSKIKGMTLESVASEIQRAGAVDAINLDGGSSTALWIKGRTVTHQSDLVIDSHIIEPASERREVGVANAILIEGDAKVLATDGHR